LNIKGCDTKGKEETNPPQAGGVKFSEQALIHFQRHTRMSRSNLHKIVKYAMSHDKRYAQWMLIYGMLKLMDLTHRKPMSDRKCKEEVAKWMGVQ
jgi:hypothetical protein